MNPGHYDRYGAENYRVFLVLLQKDDPMKRLGSVSLRQQLANWSPQGDQAPVVSLGTHSHVPGIWVRGNSLPSFTATLEAGIRAGKTLAIAHCVSHFTFEVLPRIPGLFRNNCRFYPPEPQSFVWALPQHKPNAYPFNDPEWAPRLG